MKLTITLLLILASFAGFAQNSALKYNKVKTVNLNKVQGYLEHLPPGYASNPTKKYPLLIFLHGAGERGSSPADMYKVAKIGPPKEIENNGSLCFNVNGKQECFIVISPQLTGSGNWTGYAQKEFWDYILNGPENYRYDPNRIYLTGLSLGGNGVWERAYDVENGPNNLAAIAPLCAWGKTTNGCTVANRKIPVWAFHGTSDNVISYTAGLNMFNAVKNCGASAETKWSAIQDGEHWIWNDVYKTDHSNYSPNVYEWMLSKTLNNSGSGDDGSTDNTLNQSPVVDAGDDVNATLANDPVYVTAEASDPDGSVASFQWKKISGPAATLWNTDRPKLTVKDLNIGQYEFEVVVKDNDGKTAADRVLVNVADDNTTTTRIASKTTGYGQKYLEFLPEGYDPSKSYPVMVYLHSAAAEGTNLDLIKQEGPMYYINQGKNLCSNGECFIVVAPQIAKGAGFWKGKVDQFYDYVISKYSVAPDKIYLAGFDEGASDAISRLQDDTNKPNRWAGAAVVSYSAPSSQACNVAGTDAALYFSQGKSDATNDYYAAQKFYNDVVTCGVSSSKFLSSSGTQAQSWKVLFDPASSDVYSWLLARPLGTGDNDINTDTSPGGITKKVSSDGRAYMEYLPAGYSTSKKYPVIVYLHSGEAEGTNTDLLKNEGPLYFASQGQAISANGEGFIVLSPQIAKGAGFWKGKIDRFYDYMMSKYSIDPNRVYIVGYDEGAIDALFRITDTSNSPNRWAAAAVVSYNMPYSVACQVGGSGPSLYMANGKLDEVYSFSVAQTFYNKVDNCSSATTRFVTESGGQTQSWKRTFDPGVTTLYSWLLNQQLTGQTASSARTTDESMTVEEDLNDMGNLTQVEKNFRTDQYQIALTSSNEPVQIMLNSIDGRAVKSVTSQGDLPLDGIENGIYLYSVVDQSGAPIQRGRIVKY